jgi:WxcM-like protein
MDPHLPSRLAHANKRRAAPATSLPLLGAKLVKLPNHRNRMGCLIALDREQSVPFDLRRVYCIYASHGKSVRGGHATSAHCAIVALRGAVEVDLDNGQERATVRLSRPDRALCLHAGVWLRLRKFSKDAILLVAASKLYAEVAYFDRPNPRLLKSVRRAWR